jgi:hypothetical protein
MGSQLAVSHSLDDWDIYLRFSCWSFHRAILLLARFTKPASLIPIVVPSFISSL